MPLDIAGEVATRSDLRARFFETRAHSADIVAPLTPEDQAVQAMDDASPAKWHLAHTTWFFEELVLKAFAPDYREADPRFAYCFNSYYESLGPRHPRARRGLLTRPSAGEVAGYRAQIDEAMARLFDKGLPDAARDVIEIGIHHEQQHQELMLTDILALFAAQPLRPAYRPASPPAGPCPEANSAWLRFPGGIHETGHAGGGFAYDNEGPRHQVLLRDFELAGRLVTCGAWLDFMADGGYANPALWLADGWATVQREGWTAPGYWEFRDGAWEEMTLHGPVPVERAKPVCHVSFFEADAFARWAGARLPSEFEWEAAAGEVSPRSGFDFGNLRPGPQTGEGVQGLFGEVWQWTQSAYLPYPGYRAVPGPLGEYNGKFMSGQMVLRGSSCLTPNRHARRTYRNFFYPHQRWQMVGLRLARDV
jgi:ergothioneine biosynthesis protein EgtB